MLGCSMVFLSFRSKAMWYSPQWCGTWFTFRLHRRPWTETNRNWQQGLEDYLQASWKFEWLS
jgi:hypothetical protein